MSFSMFEAPTEVDGSASLSYRIIVHTKKKHLRVRITHTRLCCNCGCGCGWMHAQYYLLLLCVCILVANLPLCMPLPVFAEPSRTSCATMSGSNHVGNRHGHQSVCTCQSSARLRCIAYVMSLSRQNAYQVEMPCRLAGV